MKLVQTLDVNSVPCSLTMSPGIPKYQTAWIKMSSAVSKAVGKPCRGTRCKDLEKCSMAIIIAMLPLDIGRSVTKSIVMWYQMRYGMDSGMSLPTSNMQSTLACVQAVQDEM